MGDDRPPMLDLLLETIDVFITASVSLRAAFDQDHARVADLFPDEADFRRGIAVGVNLALNDVDLMLTMSRDALLDRRPS